MKEHACRHDTGQRRSERQDCPGMPADIEEIRPGPEPGKMFIQDIRYSFPPDPEKAWPLRWSGVAESFVAPS